MMSVPAQRIRVLTEAGPNPDGHYVLYWMTAFRRLEWNFALQRAANLARRYSKPLLILEILKLDYPYACPRFHEFILQGMAERSVRLAEGPVIHHPFVEERAGEGEGLIQALASRATWVVSDDFPTFLPSRLVVEAKAGISAPLEVVDSNGLLPLRATDRVFNAAYHFRRYLQKTLPEHLGAFPAEDPLADPLVDGRGVVEESIRSRWPPWPVELLRDPGTRVEKMGLDPSVPRAELKGDSASARKRLSRFLEGHLDRYHDHGNHPDLDATSRLSPALHFGAISTHEIFSQVASREGWTPARLSMKTDGSREGWWGMGAGPEAFLDQLVTWRELGFNVASKTEDFAEYRAIPEWAQKTLAEHEGDPRPYLYAYQDFKEARTHDPLWNAAQRQLLEEGVIHNYLRMLWGKMILEWTRSPSEALEIMIDLNDRYALDGRDPNSYSGILWCLGRYDRGWPERPVFGKVRSMSSKRTRKKVRVEAYLNRFGPQREG